MNCFASSLQFLPYLLRIYQNNLQKLTLLIPISMKNDETLNIIIPYIPEILIDLLKNPEFVFRLKNQKHLELLYQFHPILFASLFTYKNNDKLSETILEIIILSGNIQNSNIQNNDNNLSLNPPNSFVELLKIIENIKIKNISRESAKVLFDLAKGGENIENLSAIVVLSYCCQNKLLTKEYEDVIKEIVMKKLENPNELVRSAAIVCISCFTKFLL